MVPKHTLRSALIAVGLGLLAGCVADQRSQQRPAKVATIGYLTPGGASPSAFRDAFETGLREHGYVQGQNIGIEYRWAGGDDGHLPALARELVDLGVDVIVAASSPAVVAAKNATGTIPIVMVAVGDPVGSGLVASLARPGGNVTGVTVLSTEVAAKRLEILKETLPTVLRVAVLGNLANPAKLRDWEETRDGGRALGIELEPLDVRDAAEFDAAFETAARAHALLVLGDPLTVIHRDRIIELAFHHGLPSMFDSADFVDSGGLMAYGTNRPDLYGRAAAYVAKILRGASPGDLPVEQPTRFDLVINLKAAAALGVDIPQLVLARADRVMQ